jgi:hypothetical protein
MATVHHNPALHQEPMSEKAHVIPIRDKESLIGWIESTGRFKSYEPDPLSNPEVSEELDEIMEPSIYKAEKDEESDEWNMDD